MATRLITDSQLSLAALPQSIISIAPASLNASVDMVVDGGD